MWPNPQFPADLVTFTEEILNGKINLLYREKYKEDYQRVCKFQSHKTSTEGSQVLWKIAKWEISAINLLSDTELGGVLPLKESTFNIMQCKHPEGRKRTTGRFISKNKSRNLLSNYTKINQKMCFENMCSGTILFWWRQLD